MRCLALVREPLDGGFAASIALGFFSELKSGKRVFLSHSILLPDPPMSPLIARTDDRGIVTVPSLLASPEEKRAHQLRRFESWCKTG